MTTAKKSFSIKGPKKFGAKTKTFKKGTVADPLADVEYTDDLEVDSEKELQALAKAYRQRQKDEEQRFREATDSEYWFAVCFKSREDKNSFLKAAGIKPRIHGDKYIAGSALAKALGIKF